MYAKIKNFPTTTGRFEVIDEIATGNMGTIYEGYDPVADRPVAIKVSRAGQVKDKEQAKRYHELFTREAATASMLHHPNILEVYDIGRENGSDYIVMELVKHARTLKDYINADDLLPIEEVVNFALQCAMGLEYAHGRGVIHRDIKPANLLVTEDHQIKIADFSIAYVQNKDYEMTMSTGFVGSPRYMSPEQVQEDLVSQQTDLYSLGVVIYELLTGIHPFEANSFSRLIYKVVNEEARHPGVIRDELPNNLGNYILHALQKDPSRRYQSATEIVNHLSRIYPDQDLSNVISSKKKDERIKDIRNMKLFRGFDENELMTVMGGSIWQRFRQGDVIIKEHDTDDCFYIIEQGEANVVKGDTLVGSLSKGDCFGEMVVITKQSRSATIVAKTDIRVMKIKAALIEEISPLSQLRLCREFLDILIRRMENPIEDNSSKN